MTVTMEPDSVCDIMSVFFPYQLPEPADNDGPSKNVFGDENRITPEFFVTEANAAVDCHKSSNETPGTDAISSRVWGVVHMARPMMLKRCFQWVERSRNAGSEAPLADQQTGETWRRSVHVQTSVLMRWRRQASEVAAGCPDGKLHGWGWNWTVQMTIRFPWNFPRFTRGLRFANACTARRLAIAVWPRGGDYGW